MKPSRKLFFLRYWNTFFIAQSRRKILSLARSNKLIYLTPVRPRGCGGNVDEYYHFIFDLLVPLHYLIKNTSSDVVFVFQSFGNNSERLERLFPNRIKIVQDTTDVDQVASGQLIGMNPKGVLLHSGDYEDFKNDIFNNLDIEQTKPSTRNKILLIERVTPDAEFLERASVTGSGAMRRSIINHDELAPAINSMVMAPYEFHNLQLEKISFNEQLEYFDRALVVIGQHGAGLSNTIWMKPDSIVIELNQNDDIVSHFNMVSSVKEHQYYLYKTSGSHAEVNIADLENWITGIESLKAIFKRD